MGKRKGRIISDISKRVLIVEGKSELDRIMHLQASDTERITNFKKLGNEVYEIEIISKVGTFYKKEELNSPPSNDEVMRMIKNGEGLPRIEGD